MITSTFPNHERGLALGLNAVVVALGVAAGPTIGGIITQYLTWRWIFYVNVLICMLMLSIGVSVESHVAHPILNLGLLSNRVFAFANISFVLCMMAFLAPGFLLPFYFEQLRGFSLMLIISNGKQAACLVNNSIESKELEGTTLSSSQFPMRSDAEI